MIDISFKNIIDWIFKRSEIKLLVIPLKEWQSNFVKNPLYAIEYINVDNAICELDTVYNSATSNIELSTIYTLSYNPPTLGDAFESNTFFFDRESKPKGLAFVYKIKAPDGNIFYTFKSVEEVKPETLIIDLK